MLVKESIDLLKSKSEKEIDDEIHARIGDKKYNLFLKFKKILEKDGARVTEHWLKDQSSFVSFMTDEYNSGKSNIEKASEAYKQAKKLGIKVHSFSGTFYVDCFQVFGGNRGLERTWSEEGAKKLVETLKQVTTSRSMNFYYEPDKTYMSSGEIMKIKPLNNESK